jgi:hypothetical protein
MTWSRHFSVVKAATTAICALIVAYGAFLFFARSAPLSGVTLQTQSTQPVRGKLTVVTGDSAICYRTYFDNKSSHIVSVEKGWCNEMGAPTARDLSDQDGPLGSIRKALNGK